MRITAAGANRLKINYSQVVLSPENIRLSFGEEWGAESTLKFLLNRGLALDVPYTVREYQRQIPKKIIIGLNVREKRELDYFYAGFFELINPLPIPAVQSKQSQLSQDICFEKQEQLTLHLA